MPSPPPQLSILTLGAITQFQILSHICSGRGRVLGSPVGWSLAWVSRSKLAQGQGAASSGASRRCPQELPLPCIWAAGFQEHVLCVAQHSPAGELALARSIFFRSLPFPGGLGPDPTIFCPLYWASDKVFGGSCSPKCEIHLALLGPSALFSFALQGLPLPRLAHHVCDSFLSMDELEACRHSLCLFSTPSSA